jgi:glycosyltransferase involved in cell wall biosynthesis
VQEAKRVAVIIACHDDGATIRAAVASLEGQEASELAIVDDGSKDPATLDVLAELEGGPASVVRQENRGPAAARMAGVAATSARYVLALDADDQLERGALTELADALDSNPDAILAWGDTEMFGATSFRVQKGSTLDPWLITYVNSLPISTLVRREALLAVGGWQLATGYEDWDLWMAFAERGWQGVHIGRTVGRHRVHGARRFAGDFSRHEQAYAELRTRHEALFAHRAQNRRRSISPRRLRLLLPVIDRLPLSTRMRFRLTLLSDQPVTVMRLWAAGRRNR